MQTSDNYSDELLKYLGFGEGVSFNEADVEAARMQMCHALSLAITTPDDALLSVARRVGYVPLLDRPSAAAESGPLPTETRPDIDVDQLAKIPRSTQTGLKKLGSVRNTQSGMKPVGSADSSNSGLKPLYARGTEAGSAHPEKPSGAGAQEPSASQLKMQTLKASRRTSVDLDEHVSQPKLGLVAAIANTIKKLFARE